jgi:hypothetical protein
VIESKQDVVGEGHNQEKIVIVAKKLISKKLT